MLSVWVPGAPHFVDTSDALYYTNSGELKPRRTLKTDVWREHIFEAMAPHRPSTPPKHSAFRVVLEFSIKRADSSRNKPDEELVRYHRASPALMRMAEEVLDELQAMGFWGRKTQIAALALTKRWEDPISGREGCQVYIEELVG